MDAAVLTAGADFGVLEDGRELWLLPAAQVLAARREAEELAQGEAERALCGNACLLAYALRKNGRRLYADGQAVLDALSVQEIGALAKAWRGLDRAENPGPETDRTTVMALKRALEEDGGERLRWRVLRTFGALPTEERARAMKARDYLWCALNLMLDEEEALDALCPTCRREAEEGRCPSCGAPVGRKDGGGDNPAFDWERFEELRQGGGT